MGAVPGRELQHLLRTLPHLGLQAKLCSNVGARSAQVPWQGVRRVLVPTPCSPGAGQPGTSGSTNHSVRRVACSTEDAARLSHATSRRSTKRYGPTIARRCHGQAVAARETLDKAVGSQNSTARGPTSRRRRRLRLFWNS